MSILLAGSHSRKDLQQVARRLHKRLRITDVSGHRGPVTIGVLLTDTPESGGRVVFSDLENLLASAGLNCDLELFVYDPTDGDSGLSPAGERTERETSSDHRSPPSTHVGGTKAFAKRFVDIVGSVIGLIVAAVPIAVAALAIKATSPGPVIFRQVREGANGRRFTIFKLRTMIADAEAQQASLLQHNERNGPAFKMTRDPRVTSVGKVLRATCIDELPQLVNVLWGDMSLVGPRPLPWSESRAVQPWQRRRLAVKPGITGIWQTEKHEAISFDE
ncbi:MAG: sugar transferase [Pirellulaceae bacterium]